jgi:RimJ/RimL family protein N-acetyltransferase
MIRLIEVDRNSMAHIQLLFKLLQERQPWQAISHKKMPSFGEHMSFVKSKPYAGWYLIVENATDHIQDDVPVGSTYITHNNEVGIFIFKEHHGKGYGKEGLDILMGAYDPPFYANINPANHISREFFTKLGFKFIQTTYMLGEEDAK